MSPVRRSSSQYSLFPSCSPSASPLQSPTSSTPHGKIGNTRNLHKRHSVGSVRERAQANINKSLRAASLSTSDFATNENNNNTNKFHLAINHPQANQTANTMDRLIPLKLEAIMSDTKSSSTSQKSFPLLPLAHLGAVQIPAPLNPAQPSKRIRPGPVTDRTILPYSPAEWAAVMEEVRMLHAKGQYKHCAMRCKQLLDGVKDPSGVHPLYSIYLSFFAASSLEMTASTLNNHASTKLPLFQESLAFYQKAESYIEYAFFSSDPNLSFATRQISMYGHASHSSTSTSSSIRSSVDSVFSEASASSRFSISSSSYGDSPTFEEPSMKRSSLNYSSSESEGSLRRRKKVSFSLPTLDSETPLDLSLDTYTISDSSITPEASTLLDAFPSPPSTSTSTLSPSRSPTRYSRSSRSDSFSTFFLSQSILRYREHLTSLSAQLNFHISSIHSQISSLADARRPRRSNTCDFADENISVGGADVGEKERRPELRERIEKLKELGWKRKRFDGERYRVLCEKALVEVNERP
ncbi:uncharacterized protein RCO7_06083 [Rhynchosporium graminicola]|uniref:Uncharacterized protein n=1 Tax=Rhynchosporium graminicola TaxID=2792576 RepID=A0A1E1KXU9_9HELO|nr:uncharacterized protein RCO7_06083 [Rhynchosporium commune]